MTGGSFLNKKAFKLLRNGHFSGRKKNFETLPVVDPPQNQQFTPLLGSMGWPTSWRSTCENMIREFPIKSAMTILNIRSLDPQYLWFLWVKPASLAKMLRTKTHSDKSVCWGTPSSLTKLHLSVSPGMSSFGFFFRFFQLYRTGSCNFARLPRFALFMLFGIQFRVVFGFSKCCSFEPPW